MNWLRQVFQLITFDLALQKIPWKHQMVTVRVEQKALWSYNLFTVNLSFILRPFESVEYKLTLTKKEWSKKDIFDFTFESLLMSNKNYSFHFWPSSCNKDDVIIKHVLILIVRPPHPQKKTFEKRAAHVNVESSLIFAKAVIFQIEANESTIFSVSEFSA